MKIINRLFCNHHWHYDGEIPWFIYPGTPASMSCYLVCSKCGGRKIVSIDDWHRILDNQISRYKA